MRRIRAFLIGGLVALVAAVAVPVGTASAAPPPGATTAAIYSDFVASVAPGASFTRNWKLPVDVVPEVGLSPVGASTTAECRFETTRDWFTESSIGSVRYHWTVTNIGTIACGVTTFLTQRPKTASISISGIDPGATVPAEWNIDEAKPVFLAGLWPTGATSSTDCTLEITRTWFEREFHPVIMHIAVKNIGTIACGTRVLLSNLATGNSFLTAKITPGTTYTTLWKNVNTLTQTLWMAVSPRVDTFCSLELTRKYWAQRIDAAGTHRDVHVYVKNVGANACDAGVTFTAVS